MDTQHKLVCSRTELVCDLSHELWTVANLMYFNKYCSVIACRAVSCWCQECGNVLFMLCYDAVPSMTNVVCDSSVCCDSSTSINSHSNFVNFFGIDYVQRTFRCCFTFHIILLCVYGARLFQWWYDTNNDTWHRLGVEVGCLGGNIVTVHFYPVYWPLIPTVMSELKWQSGVDVWAQRVQSRTAFVVADDIQCNQTPISCCAPSEICAEMHQLALAASSRSWQSISTTNTLGSSHSVAEFSQKYAHTYMTAVI